jgi:hypothetical protein
LSTPAALGCAREDRIRTATQAELLEEEARRAGWRCVLLLAFFVACGTGCAWMWPAGIPSLFSP